MVGALFVVHHRPDPERSLVVGTHVVTGDQFGSVGIVTCFGGSTEIFVGPVDGFIVDVSTSVSKFVVLVEIRVFDSGVFLHTLS